jgi:hypothetical protein
MESGGEMKPAHSILDHTFRYVPATSTSVAQTWRRFGWRPVTDEERKRRRWPNGKFGLEAVGAATPIRGLRR